jgi:hypothetical protein
MFVCDHQLTTGQLRIKWKQESLTQALHTLFVKTSLGKQLAQSKEGLHIFPLKMRSEMKGEIVLDC